jgi:AraC-like DNA-binding protein
MELKAGFREHVSPHGLEDAVSAVWIRVMPDHPVPPVEVWPDAGIDIIWQRGGEPLVAGPDTKPVPAELDPGAVLIGMRFLPGAGGPALATAMSELRNQRVALSAVRPELARRLDGGLDPYEALRRIVDAVRRRVEAHPPDSLVASTVRSLNTPTASVAAAVAESSLGIRQIRRRFHQTLGYGPKTLQRVLRFQRLVAASGSTRSADLATLALELGYSDQAHMTRESRRFSGRTPVELRRLVTDSFKTDRDPTRHDPRHDA